MALLEFVLRGVGGAVDALELLVLLVAAMVGAGDVEELERLRPWRCSGRGCRRRGRRTRRSYQNEMVSPAGMSPRRPSLVGVLAAFADQLSASSRVHSKRSNFWFSLEMRRISSSIFTRSSAVKVWSRSKS
jgi:hypothetical protein